MFLVFFLISIDSPVKVASFTFISPLNNIPSAGILSPVSSLIISLTTISLIITSLSCLFLITLTLILLISSCKFLNASSDPYSDIVLTSDARATAIKIPIVSYQSYFENINSNLIHKEINNIFKYCFHFKLYFCFFLDV